MQDGDYTLKHSGMFISSRVLPVFRVFRDDGLLELLIRDRDRSFSVLVPLDATAVSKLAYVDEAGCAIEKDVVTNLSFFSGEPFPAPRPPNDTSVPERITYALPSDAGYIARIDLFNDAPLPRKAE